MEVVSHVTGGWVKKNHQKEVQSSKEEKFEYAVLAKEKKCITACYDLQAVLPNLCDNVSVVCYKWRLSLLNFTVYDIGRSTRHWYVWHEGASKRGSNEIGSCVFHFLQNECKGEMVAFNSDNCRGQQRINTLLLYTCLLYTSRCV